MCTFVYGLSVYALLPPKFICSNHNIRSGVFGRYSGYQGGALVNKMSSFIKRDPDSSFPLFCHMRTHQKQGHLCTEPGDRHSPDTKSVSDSILDFPASITARSISIVYKPPNGICYSSLNSLSHVSIHLNVICLGLHFSFLSSLPQNFFSGI